MPKQLSAPLTPEEAVSLAAGDEVLISGSLLTARDVAHQRLCALLEQGKELPVDLQNQIIYFTGPTPSQRRPPRRQRRSNDQLPHGRLFTPAHQRRGNPRYDRQGRSLP